MPTAGLNNSAEVRGPDVPSTLQYDANLLEEADTSSSSGMLFRLVYIVTLLATIK